jgi:uncharacterized protein (DUF697 family)
MLNVLKQARAAFAVLKPEEAQRRARRPVHIGLVAVDHAGYAEMERFLIPEAAGAQLRAVAGELVHRSTDPSVPPSVDFVMYQGGLERPSGAIGFDSGNPRATIAQMLRADEELVLPLARHFPAFRPAVVERIVHGISLENALFAFATAVPDIVPSLIELPWAIGEFASDMAFLTANQIRMAFLVAAACGAPVGFQNQKAEMLTIAAGGFGWRAIARELVGKIPFGGGLIPKAAVAYAGTFAVGKGLAYHYEANRQYTRQERKAVYREALGKGRAVAESLGRETPLRAADKGR